MSRFKNTPQLLQQLNEAAVFVHFEDTSWHNEPTDSAQAGYFTDMISISFPNATKKDADNVDTYASFYLQLFMADAQGLYEKKPYPPFDNDFDTLEEAAGAVNAYIRSRPFKIIDYGGGLYQLLDPEGMDYIGDFIGLVDAKRTCCNNFIL